MNRDAEYTGILRGRLTERRFIHSLNVADSARELAEIYGCDPDKAYTAGLIHDCCKDEPAGLQLSYMLGNGAELTECEINTAKLYHSICGSIFIQKEFGIDDIEIINAVRYHTTGRANMSVLEKVIFIADFISAERDYNGVEIMREKAKHSLDEAIVEGLSFTIKDLIDAGRIIHPDTLGAYNDAIANVEKSRRER